jgi:hypothetical protein
MNRLVKAFSNSQAFTSIVLLSQKSQKPHQSITLDSFAEIAYAAVYHKDSSRNTITLTFLSALNNRGGFIQAHSASQQMKLLPEILLHTPIDVVMWQAPDRDDPFNQIVNLPPLSIINIEYLGLAIVFSKVFLEMPGLAIMVSSLVVSLILQQLYLPDIVILFRWWLRPVT